MVRESFFAVLWNTSNVIPSFRLDLVLTAQPPVITPHTHQASSYHYSMFKWISQFLKSQSTKVTLGEWCEGATNRTGERITQDIHMTRGQHSEPTWHAKNLQENGVRLWIDIYWEWMDIIESSIHELLSLSTISYPGNVSVPSIWIFYIFFHSLLFIMMLS